MLIIVPTYFGTDGQCQWIARVSCAVKLYKDLLAVDVETASSMWLVKRQCDLDGRTAGLSAVYKKNFSWLWEASVMQLVIFSGVFIQFLDYRTFLSSTGLILCFI